MVAWRQSAIRSSMHGRKKGAEAYATGQARVATQGNMMGCEREDTQISRRRLRTGRGRRRAPLGKPGEQLLTLVAVAHQIIQLVWCVLCVHDVHTQFAYARGRHNVGMHVTHAASRRCRHTPRHSRQLHPMIASAQARAHAVSRSGVGTLSTQRLGARLASCASRCSLRMALNSESDADALPECCGRDVRACAWACAQASGVASSCTARARAWT